MEFDSYVTVYLLSYTRMQSQQCTKVDILPANMMSAEGRAVHKKVKL